MVGRHLLSRLRSLPLPRGHRPASPRFSPSKKNLAFTHITPEQAAEIRTEIKQVTSMVNSGVGGLKEKMEKGFESLNKSFESFKTDSESAVTKIQRSWYWYQASCIALATLLLGRDIMESYGATPSK